MFWRPMASDLCISARIDRTGCFGVKLMLSTVLISNGVTVPSFAIRRSESVRLSLTDMPSQTGWLSIIF